MKPTQFVIMCVLFGHDFYRGYCQTCGKKMGT